MEGERTQPLRIAVAGTGMIGSIHARSARLAGATLVAVAASTPARGEQAARELGAERAAATAEQLATADDVDVLHVCTPNHLHAPLTKLALEHGKHVVCEKPVALDRAEAEQLALDAADAGRFVAVPFVYRYHPVVRHARALVADGALGDVRLMHGTYLQDWLLQPSDTNWRVDVALGGRSRAFADIGSHWCDLASFVSGHRFTAVQGATETTVPERDGTPAATEDVAVATLRTDRGALANVVVSQVSPGRKNRLWLELDGSLQSVAFDQQQPETLWLGARDGARLITRDPEQLAPAAKRFAVVPGGHPQGYLDCFDAFVRDVYAGIAAGELPDGTPQLADGVRAAAVTDAVLEAAESGGWSEIGARTHTTTANGGAPR
ncbi:Gfo/Idh/MocA family oxidoreductase [Conexibacter sp. JD483]|uniref:Gfo/Idh/MocA family protein n=1 Tax=unclassified Conexibacter TaxID=2627773 RepID=UPI00271A002C|nr:MULTISPECIES: Gfo/Idh/MocA family oxidoreductase [unclassified Conexibacter]MDO8189264.1 Gfo/Idh/MocA family oxidoreductase [Conexibacter sp. CPCC 205706]MDO8201271.1 Gfo/Idh/MocA family oxidoreductase [Conexibacter sp. CPCC 205762]MDR9372174.1 Gfo/Idh/MocA family oxidoreductase [Conexibacter sp. JD483]